MAAAGGHLHGGFLSSADCPVLSSGACERRDRHIVRLALAVGNGPAGCGPIPRCRRRNRASHLCHRSAHSWVVGHGHLADRDRNRSEERSVGKECFSTCSSSWSAYTYNKNTNLTHLIKN